MKAAAILTRHCPSGTEAWPYNLLPQIWSLSMHLKTTDDSLLSLLSSYLISSLKLMLTGFLAQQKGIQLSFWIVCWRMEINYSEAWLPHCFNQSWACREVWGKSNRFQTTLQILFWGLCKLHILQVTYSHPVQDHSFGSTVVLTSCLFLANKQQHLQKRTDY